MRYVQNPMAYKAYIALTETPKIWRAIVVPNSYTFSDLHMSIQSAMGWSNTHLYEFNLYNQENKFDAAIAVPDEYYEPNRSFIDSRKTMLSDMFSEPILYAKYIYDFGDFWEHWLKLVEVPDIAEYAQLPVCCSGNGICPPENVGGVGEYLSQRTSAKSTEFGMEPSQDGVSSSCHVDLTCFDKDEISFWGFVKDDTTLTPSECDLWIRRLMQGDISIDEVVSDLCSAIPVQDITDLYEAVISKPLKVRNKATMILGHAKGIGIPFISECVFVPTRTIHDVISRYKRKGVQQSIFNKKKGFKHEIPGYIDKVFSILHAPPSSYGFNRTSWRQEDIMKVMADEGMGIGKGGLLEIIRNSGYSYKKARTVLTSNDPEYREKLNHITNILSNLGSDEKFFSIDEYGPFAIKLKGGKSLVPPGVNKSVPQWQKSKGSLILTAALELSTNQITHFYSAKKNTKEMIKLLWKLIETYSEEKTIYFSWDAASWHASKELYETVENINSKEYRDNNITPIIKLAPLPSSAQFLNVIESIFSGMARAIMHNSDYQSVGDCKEAIDKYFCERNERFKKNPRRAGNKIWGEERVKPSFSESNNCKDPRYR
jgi:hypothetical protein